MEFFLSVGGNVSSSISLTHIPGQGRCYIANEDIKEDTDLFNIPRTCLLNTRNSLLPDLCRKWETENGKTSIKASASATDKDEDMDVDVDVKADMASALVDSDEESSIEPEDPPEPQTWQDLQGWSPLILCMMWEQWRSSDDGHKASEELFKQADTSSAASMNWRPYLDIMPKDFSNMPMFWPDEDLKELVGTTLPEKVGREDADTEYVFSVRKFVLSHAVIFLGPDAEKKDQKALEKLVDQHYSLENFHIQGSRILSRSFHVKKEDQAEVKDGQPVAAGETAEGEGEGDDEGQDSDSDSDSESNSDDEETEDKEDTADISMVPMADMLNASYASENARLFYHTSSLIMRATRDIKRGEQILNTYADPPNADLLRRYGYTDAWNGADEVEIHNAVLVDALMQMEGRISADETVPKSAKDKKRQNDLTTRTMFCVYLGLEESYVLTSCFPPSDKPPHRPEPTHPSDKEIKSAMSNFDEELLIATRAMLLTDEEWDKHRSKEKMPKPKLDGPIVDVLLIALRRRLAMYVGGASSKEDEDRIYGSSASAQQHLSTNHRNAIIVRLGEKRVIENNIMVLERLKGIHEAEEKEKKKKQGTSTAATSKTEAGKDANKRKAGQQSTNSASGNNSKKSRK